ncbi:MAG: hypothetical protein GY792_14080 [Gammaproteobacteria bacterium]|nr:hypothetical protein [Gammaproteobacteria bacterium]
MLLFAAGPVQSAKPLVDSAWLTENLDKPDVRVLDLQHPKGYLQAHLLGSVNTNYGKWRQTGHNGVPSVIPDKAYLEELIGRLGIDNRTHVVLAPLGAGASDMAVATRIYWTFRAVGHDEIPICHWWFWTKSGSRIVSYWVKIIWIKCETALASAEIPAQLHNSSFRRMPESRETTTVSGFGSRHSPG